MSTDPADLVRAGLRGIDLAELNARAALQTRVDSKYVVPLSVFAQLVDVLAGQHDCLLIDARADQQYDTVYFDTADLANYRAHLQRRRLAFKLRTRTYTESGRCSFEVKLLDGRRSTVKKRIGYDNRPADRIDADAEAFYRATVRQHYGVDPTTSYGVVLHNRYRRITLAARIGEERTTIDHELQFLDAPDGAPLAALDPDHVLIETKTAHGNGSVDRALWALGARPTRMSKYCIGVGLTAAPVPSNRYHRAMVRWYGWDGSRGRIPAGRPAGMPEVALVRPPRAPQPPRPPRAPRGRRPLRTASADD